MPWAHRWIGNPVLTFILNVFFGVRVSDAHCGMRAIRRVRRAQARAPGDGDGVRLRDDPQGVEAQAARRRDPDRLPAADRRVEAEHLAGRLASPAVHAPPQLDVPLPDPGTRAARARARDHASARNRAGRRVRGHLVHPRDDRRVAGDARRRADRAARPLRPELRAALPERARPVARAALDPGPARARTAARRRADTDRRRRPDRDLRRVGIGRLPRARPRARGPLRHDPGRPRSADALRLVLPQRARAAQAPACWDPPPARSTAARPQRIETSWPPVPISVERPSRHRSRAQPAVSGDAERPPWVRRRVWPLVNRESEFVHRLPATA